MKSSSKQSRVAFNALPDVIPIFPLEGALLLPNARLPLNIFEPRYLAMVDDAIRSETRLIGMIQPRPPKPGTEEAESDPVNLYEIGCAGRIVSFTETDDGRYLISLAGMLRFRIQGEVEGFQPYRRASVNWADFEDDLRHKPAGALDKDERAAFLELLKAYFEATDMTADWSALTRADEETLVNALAMLAGFSPQEKQALLEAPSLADRKRDLLALMRFSLAAHGGSSGATQ